MAKPILVVHLPKEYLPRTTLTEAMAGITKYVNNEYYVFCGYADDDLLGIQVFHEKDFTDIQYSELYDLIKNSLNNKL